MVRDAANFDCFKNVLPGDPAYEWPKPFSNFRCDYGQASFGSKYTMKIGAHVGHNAEFNRPFGTHGNSNQHPALKRRAIVMTSLRDSPTSPDPRDDPEPPFLSGRPRTPVPFGTTKTSSPVPSKTNETSVPSKTTKNIRPFRNDKKHPSLRNSPKHPSFPEQP